MTVFDDKVFRDCPRNGLQHSLLASSPPLAPPLQKEKSFHAVTYPIV